MSVFADLASSPYAAAFRDGLRPQPPLSVDRWADEFRVLSREGAAEPGPYRTARTPYLREIMEALSDDHPCQEVVVQKAAQLGFSELGNNWIGYVIDRSPGPMMIVQPTIDLAEDYSKQRLAPMFRDCPTLAEKIAPAKSRDSSNTLRQKYFPGGMLAIAGANSSAALRSKPIKRLFLDEIDAYPIDVDGEGCPVALAEKRTATFSRRKILKGSTPTVKGISKIEAAFEASSRGRFFVPCPYCSHRQHLVWGSVRWDKMADGTPNLASVRYECASCRQPIREHHKTAMLAAGAWVHEDPANPVRGFHVNALYSPVGWCSWAELAKQWHRAQGNPVLLKAFVNTNLGETYEIRGEDAPKWRELYDRREQYPLGIVPRGALILTAGADVQKDRIELYVWGWNRKEGWLVDRSVFYGDTSTDSPYNQADSYLDIPLPTFGGGAMPIHLLAADTGYNTTRVYEWVRSRAGRVPRVMGVKGFDHLTMPIGTPKATEVTQGGKRIKRGVRLWPVGTDVLKAEVYGRLKMRPPTDGERAAGASYPATYLHVPMVDEEFFKQLTAETQVLVKDRRGHSHYHWIKTYPANEALDCLCYALAAYYAAGLFKWPDTRWQELEGAAGALPAAPPSSVAVAAAPTKPAETPPTIAVAQPPAQPAPKPPSPKPAPRRRESSFW